MHSTIDLADPMSREGSGTSWIPDSSPMYGRMFMFGENMLMLHGAIFPRYTNVSTRRGDDRIDAPNWFMAMFSHPLGDSAQFGSRLMMSLDPLTEGGRGYPLLFQTGEVWNGEALHDRQHPHDLFDELSFSLSQKFEHDLSAYIYFGYPGEPALGPPAFMHRPSAMDDPDAPIGHHWQDSTHITFGVATLGAQWHNVKLEGSIFTGREPDEDRYDFDRPRFDSYSGRLSWNPTRNLALQVSYGYIKSPEELHPETKIHRTTASAIYNLPLGRDTNWSNTFVWGQNNATEEGKTQSFLIESNYQRGRDTVYFRWERVQKSGHELVLDEADESEIFPVSGYIARLRPRPVARQRYRHRSRHPIHHQRSARYSRSLLRRRSRLRLPIFPPHPSIPAQSRRTRTCRANSRNGKIIARSGPSIEPGVSCGPNVRTWEAVTPQNQGKILASTRGIPAC